MKKVFLFLFIFALSCSENEYDFIIENGLIIDGSGKSSYISTIYIKNGRIAHLEKSLSNVKAKKKIDATGKVVSPGFIDMHTHSERNSFCLLYTSPSPRDRQKSRMPSSA